MATRLLRIRRILWHGLHAWSDMHRWEVLHYWYTKRFNETTTHAH